MICSAKPVLIWDLHIVYKEEFSITCYMSDAYTWQRPSILIRDNPIFSSVRMFHKDYYRKSPFGKNNLVVSQGASRQDELIGSKPPVVK
jgi:hypothetical protein